MRFKKSPPFRKSANNEVMHHSMLPLLISCTITEFSVTLLWLSITKDKNIANLFATSQIRQLQLFSTDLTSNFWTIAQHLGKITNTVSLRFISLSLPSKNRPERAYWQWIVCTMKKGNDRYLWSEGKNIHVVCCDENYFPWGKFKLFSSLFHSVYLVFSIRLVSFANLFAHVHDLWDVCNKDKCCVVTYRAVDIRIPWIVYLACLPWIKISHLDKARGVEWPFLASTHLDPYQPYGLKNFVQNNAFAFL